MTVDRARWSAHLSTLFREHPRAERPAAAAQAGFRWVDAWWPAPDERETWAAAVRASGLGLACLNADGGDLERGERGFLNVPEWRERCVAAMREAVELAVSLGGRTVHVLVGRHVPHVRESRQRAAAVEALRECAAIAAEHGIKVAVENINARDIPGYLVPTPRAAVDLIDAVGSEHVRLLYDCYHAARMAIDPIAEAPALVDSIGHVHYADHPGRGEPGSGEIDVWRFAEALADAGYRGRVGLEFFPSGSTLDALAFLEHGR